MKKQNSSELFESQDIEVSCPQKMVWDEMDVVGDGRRHCEGCDKTLFDVTGYSKEEVETLQIKHGNICVGITNTLLVSSLSLSLLSAGGDISEIENEKFSNESFVNIVEEIPKLAPNTIVMVGMPPPLPPLPSLPLCDEGTQNLNMIKKFFGFEVDTSCRDRED